MARESTINGNLEPLIQLAPAVEDEDDIRPWRVEPRSRWDEEAARMQRINDCINGPYTAAAILGGPPLIVAGVGGILLLAYPERPDIGGGVIFGGLLYGVCVGLSWLRVTYCTREQN
ncbi:hypothetical protein [Cupriavidus sp. AU9028]|uniref:hypothetical protein n=1 Tax=Cupriavidus sp. AU9028 TaxID=2871157 RepID=UPI001C943587|nr:hypothetical protein [Cupriavidus sp. AU9028]MBY4897916.1 hypothetical protein [Cupriavidus sp. AU9028]